MSIIPPNTAAFDPKLREAMAKMLEIAREYDICAVVILGTRTHAETRFRFPTWSVAQVEEKDGRNGIRFKAKSAPPEDVADTISFLELVGRQCNGNGNSCNDILEALKDRGWDFDTEIQEGPKAPPWDYR